MRVQTIHALGVAEAVLNLQAKEMEESAARCSTAGIAELNTVTARDLRRHAEELKRYRETEGKNK